jgi:hypothetical protein
MKEWGQNTAKAVKSVGKAAKGVVTAFTGSDGAAGAIKGAGDAIKTALSGIPVFGAGTGRGVWVLNCPSSRNHGKL